MSDPRTEAAARAVHTYLYESAWAEASDWQLARCRNEAATVLAAADEVDRQAGIVRAKLDDDLVERAAEAIHHIEYPTYSDTAHPDSNRWSWRGDGFDDEHRDWYRDQARAALSVLRQSVEGTRQ